MTWWQWLVCAALAFVALVVIGHVSEVWLRRDAVAKKARERHVAKELMLRRIIERLRRENSGLRALRRAGGAAWQADALRYRWLRRGEPAAVHGAATERSGRQPYVVMELPGVELTQLQLHGAALDSTLDSIMEKEAG